MPSIDWDVIKRDVRSVETLSVWEERKRNEYRTRTPGQSNYGRDAQENTSNVDIYFRGHLATFSGYHGSSGFWPNCP